MFEGHGPRVLYSCPVRVGSYEPPLSPVRSQGPGIKQELVGTFALNRPDAFCSRAAPAHVLSADCTNYNSTSLIALQRSVNSLLSDFLTRNHVVELVLESVQNPTPYYDADANPVSPEGRPRDVVIASESRALRDIAALDRSQCGTAWRYTRRPQSRGRGGFGLSVFLMKFS
ncbi:hypothetical protein EVAR_29287_1 [Eumeta japonica]|uniref:Uncharacterized protein n=1 Tax=Eumeta variegata TaxID=151549 RepID=A0A4C1VX24_EUMVA|nr:hypothetical protein EVAR_29287_1 [Eumeta japonica]